MAWGRKAKRIAELEVELAHTREHLGIARVVAGHPALAQDVTVEKGVWYTMQYMFQHDGGPSLRLANLVVERADFSGARRLVDGELQ